MGVKYIHNYVVGEKVLIEIGYNTTTGIIKTLLGDGRVMVTLTDGGQMNVEPSRLKRISE